MTFAQKLPRGARKTIETARKYWAGIARANGWYVRPFFVQVWLKKDGTAQDSVAFKGMTGDIILIEN